MPRYALAIPSGWSERRHGDTIEATTTRGAAIRVTLLVTRAETVEALADEQRTAVARGHDVVAQDTFTTPPAVRIRYEGFPAVGGGSVGMPQTGRLRHRWVETCLLGDGTAACIECRAEVEDFDGACRAHDAIVARFRFRT
jgi:hypothetical protein